MADKPGLADWLVRVIKANWTDWLVGAVGVGVIVLGVWLARGGAKIEQSMSVLITFGALLLAWPMLSTRLSKLTIGKDGVSFELKDKLAEVESKIASAQTDVSLLATRVERGREARLRQGDFLNQVGKQLNIASEFEVPASDAPLKKAAAEKEDLVKKEYGGVGSVKGGRVLTAKIAEHPTVPDWAVIDLKVEATLFAPRIVDPVTFHLHPTFAPNDKQVISPDSTGVVRFQVTSYGAFTVGVDTDNGARLGLDLATAPGSFDPWNKR